MAVQPQKILLANNNNRFISASIYNIGSLLDCARIA